MNLGRVLETLGAASLVHGGDEDQNDAAMTNKGFFLGSKMKKREKKKLGISPPVQPTCAIYKRPQDTATEV